MLFGKIKNEYDKHQAKINTQSQKARFYVVNL